ncbi:hypothetical protein DFQ04_2301 [Algoriphagus boseongensis]|uniref:Tissue inhibitor of metalloproteinase n=1 Tax=Algoriphagus boseongensis TaxID=1442587 RepID=A0A4R6T8Q0_9BACT|nr:hypothetical protein [Algoriphagus boseongensis]TDQ17645.1 hypothetical protein DFQ04_2301 [Algoriphagus boseongensis]
MKRHILLSFFLLASTISFASDCLRIRNLKKAQKEEFLDSDLIFIGKTISINLDGSYELEVIEILKGTLAASTVLGGIHDKLFGMTPFEIGETWLVYTIKNQDGTVTIPNCGLSRSTRFPFYYGSPYLPPPPPPLEFSLPIFELEIIWLKNQKRALKELQREVERIRKWVKRDKEV